MSRPTIAIVLHSGDMGDATEADFDRWTAFVISRLADRCGFEVEVDAARFGEAGDDVPRWCDDDQRTVIREVLHDLWDEWCAGGDS